MTATKRTVAGDELLVQLVSGPGRDWPYPLYALLRADCGVFRSDLTNLWVASRYEHVSTVLRDRRFGKVFDRKLQNQGRWQEGRLSPESSMRSRLLLNLDPPEHTRLRDLAMPWFSPEAVAQLEPSVRAAAASGMEALDADADVIDVAESMAAPLAASVIAPILGVPAEDCPRLQTWSHDGAASSDPLRPPDVQARGDAAAEGFERYFTRLIASHRRRPADDLTSALIAELDRGRVRSEAELVGLLVTIFIAGFETSANFGPMAVASLLRHPDQLEQVSRDRSLVGAAVDEALRWDCPIQLTTRTALADVRLGDAVIPRGATVVALLGAANRDPDHLGDAERFDLARPDKRGVPFGGGIHFCLGAQLARLEATVVLDTLLDRVRRPELAEPPTWRGTLVFRGIRSLPVRGRR